MAKIGFIGLGNMGGGMAANLIKAGHDVKVYDLDAALIDELVAQGAEACRSASSAADDVECIVSMLPNGNIVEGLYIDDEALLDFMDPSTLVIDSSTIAPASARRVHEEAQRKNIAFIDAPVSGGTAAASGGTLTFICGGTDDNVAKAKPILEAMGKNIMHAGDAGAGQIAKICNNMLLAIHMIGSSEALQLGIDNGLDPKVLSDIMLASSGRNWSLEVYNPVPEVMEGVPASNNYEGGFAVDLMNKDLGLATEAATNSRSATPLGNLAANLYKLHSKAGNGKQDFSSILNLIAGDND